jgi:GR25 family glycosyltransferase involved in LPS biosynthesis
MTERAERVISAYVINLDRDTTRMQHVTRELGRAGLDFVRFRGVDGSKVAQSGQRDADIDRTCMVACTPGVIGCALSHLDVWRHVVQKGHAATLIMEDDVHLYPNFKHRLDHALSKVPDDFDILLLGHHRADGTATGGITSSVTRTPRRINDTIVVPPMFYGMHCYVVSAKGARRLADMQVAYQVDIQLALDPRIKVYATSSNLAKQRGTFGSTVSPRHFPQTLNGILRIQEMPGLNLYGRSQVSPWLWVLCFASLGLTGLCPKLVGALFVVEAFLGPSVWWAASLAAWFSALAYSGHTRRLA